MSQTKRRIEEKAFAQAYIENGMNATQATLAIKPNLTHKSAGVEGSRLLERVSESGAIDTILEGAKVQWESIARDCMNRLHTQVQESLDPRERMESHKLLIEYGKIFAQTGVKTATQINKYTLPKR